MTLDLAALPLALLAGALSILSPCVWPLVPIVMGSAASSSRWGPWALALGLSLSFALAGTVLSFVLVSTGMDPELFRYLAAALLLLIGLLLVVKPLGDWVAMRLSLLTARFQPSGEANSAAGQFGVGLLLGLVWLPCVGPTLGAAIALASMGQQFSMAFLVMFTFGVGTASVLLAAGILSRRVIQRLSPRLSVGAERGKKLLGWMLLLLGVMALTGVDKMLEAWALTYLPDWAVEL